ncbi:MAG: hypothetical protein AAGF86_10995 [Pseudomonadota bacterium]
MWNSTLKSLSFAAMTAVCGMLVAPSSGMAAPAAGAAFAPGGLPQGVFKSQLTEKVQQRRRARARRRAARRARRGARRFRRNARRYRRGRRYRGPYIVLPSVAVPSYYYGDPYYDYDPYYYGGYDYTPAPAPGGSCGRWSRRCTANWGYGNQNYWGCMQYHGCH